MSRLREIAALGQSVWIDNLNRALIEDGHLRRLIDEDGLSGVTSNPSIFEKAMGHSDRYDDAFREAAEESDDADEVFVRLAYGDVRDAADLLRAVSSGRRARTAMSRSSSRRTSPTTPGARSRRRCATATRSTGRTCSSRSRG